LTSKLEYIRDLGVNTIWLMPFYPSPLKDDGYDIADYKGIHPQFGTLDDFRAMLLQAHRLGLKVVTELIINHTSDQHPWFQPRADRRPVRRNGISTSGTIPIRNIPKRASSFSIPRLRTGPGIRSRRPYFWHGFSVTSRT